MGSQSVSNVLVGAGVINVREMSPSLGLGHGNWAVRIKDCNSDLFPICSWVITGLCVAMKLSKSQVATLVNWVAKQYRLLRTW